MVSRSSSCGMWSKPRWDDSSTSTCRSECLPHLPGQSSLCPRHQHLGLDHHGCRQDTRRDGEGHEGYPPAHDGPGDGEDQPDPSAGAERAPPSPPHHSLIAWGALRPMRLSQHDSPGRSCPVRVVHPRIHSTTPPASPNASSIVPILMDAGANRSCVRYPIPPSGASRPRMRRVTRLVTPLATRKSPNTTKNRTTATTADEWCPDAGAGTVSKRPRSGRLRRRRSTGTLEVR